MRGFSDFSPGFATRRCGMRSRFVASTSCTALRRTAAHSSSVCGARSSVPVRLTIVATEFHKTSASGSMIDVMMSLTVAVGLYCGCGGGSSRLLQPAAASTNTPMTNAVARTISRPAPDTPASGTSCRMSVRFGISWIINTITSPRLGIDPVDGAVGAAPSERAH